MGESVALPCLRRGKVSPASFVWVWPLPVRDSIFPGTEQTAEQRSSEPSWAAVGTLSGLSFHPHQSLPAPRLPLIPVWL